MYVGGQQLGQCINISLHAYTGRRGADMRSRSSKSRVGSIRLNHIELAATPAASTRGNTGLHPRKRVFGNGVLVPIAFVHSLLIRSCTGLTSPPRKCLAAQVERTFSCFACFCPASRVNDTCNQLPGLVLLHRISTGQTAARRPTQCGANTRLGGPMSDTLSDGHAKGNCSTATSLCIHRFRPPASSWLQRVGRRGGSRFARRRTTRRQATERASTGTLEACLPPPDRHSSAHTTRGVMYSIDIT